MLCQLLRRRFFSSSTASTAPRGRITAREGCILIDNGAKRNAMTLDMYRDVPGAVAAHLRGVQLSTRRVCLLAGAGTAAFGAGSDISEFPLNRTGAEAAARYSEVEDAASRALLSIPHPVLARIHGPCYGGALNLALTADLRYCADDATFCVPPAKLGIGYPRSLMDLLVNAVGPGNAKDLLFTARVVNAGEAMRMGLVNQVLPKDELDAHCDRVAESIARGLAPMTIAAAKMELAARAHYPAGSDARREAEAEADEAYAGVYESDDYKEGVRSFLERRRPIWSGK
jgi:enoyl-CoA hydratase